MKHKRKTRFYLSIRAKVTQTRITPHLTPSMQNLICPPKFIAVVSEFLKTNATSTCLIYVAQFLWHPDVSDVHRLTGERFLTCWNCYSSLLTQILQ
jgi:hypothetical protein